MRMPRLKIRDAKSDTVNPSELSPCHSLVAMESLCAARAGQGARLQSGADERGRMAEDKRYSIISVSSDEDEDIVIQAGVVESAAASVEPAVPVDPAVPVEPAAAKPAFQGVADDSDLAAREQAAVPVEDPTAASATRAEASFAEEGLTDEELRRKRRARARAAEIERLNETERQLSEKTEQSGMHKTVLALFAVGVVVCAVLYYVFFMA